MNKTQFINKVQTILAGVDESLEDDDRIAMAHGYWAAGRVITQYKKETGMDLQDIAKILEMPHYTVQEQARVYRAFPEGYPKAFDGKVVTWSSLRIICSVHDAKAREFYLKEACTQGWNRFELQRRIHQDYFGVWQDAANAGESQTLKVKPQRLYTYAAEVIKVVDGDTMDIEIDMGFKSRQEHRIRLRGINAPEMSAAKGQKAKEFVEQELARCIVPVPAFKGHRAERPLVVIRSFKSGMFGRYIVDLYYLPAESDIEVIAEKGKLLNQVLVDQGLARKAG